MGCHCLFCFLQALRNFGQFPLRSCQPATSLGQPAVGPFFAILGLVGGAVILWPVWSLIGIASCILVACIIDQLLYWLLQRWRKKKKESLLYKFLCLKYLDLDAEVKEKEIQYLLQFQKTNGGFGFTQMENINDTFWIVYILSNY